MPSFSETIKLIRERVEAEGAEARAETARAARLSARDRLVPLEDRLRRLLQTIPIEFQREGLSLTALQSSLRGRWRGSCHPGELGAALRKLGFTRRRGWHDAEGFQARWFRER